MLTFLDVWRPVARRLGDESRSGISDAKYVVNSIMREIAMRATWPFLLDEKAFVLVTAYTTGTADVTNGSPTVTGTGTTWTQDMMFRKFRLSGSDITYRIVAFTSTTSIRLDRPYAGSTATAQDYEIHKDEYGLERDTMTVIRMRIPEANRTLQAAALWKLFELEQGVESSSTPELYVDAGRTAIPYYNTGYVTTTSNSATITGSGTTFSTDFAGRLFRVRGDGIAYRIRTRDSATQLTLDSPYRGMANSSIEYEVDPAGVPLVRLWPRPSSAYHVYYWRKRSPRLATEDDDLIDFPDDFHDVVVAGGYQRVLQLRGGDLGLIGQAKQDYETLLRERVNQSAMTSADQAAQLGQWGETPAHSLLAGAYPAVYTR